MPASSTVTVTDANFDEESYLASNPDVARAVREGGFASGRRHFQLFGRSEARTMRIDPGPMDGRATSRSRLTNFLLGGARKLLPASMKEAINAYIDNRARALYQARELPTEVRDLQVVLGQVMSILTYEAKLPPPPPKYLQQRVVLSYSPDFIQRAYTSNLPTLNRALEPIGKTLQDFPAILDFGCGCGRSIRPLATLVPMSKIYGTDIDGEAIEWLKLNYSSFAEFSVAPHVPPTGYNDRMFDLVCGISVFTHLPEEMQFQWLQELSRITKAGGYLILTTHGEKYFRNLDAASVATMESKGFLYLDVGYGPSISLPAFYQVAYHSPAYIRREWGRYFEVIEIRPAALDGNQDTVLLRNRDHSDRQVPASL